MNFRQIGVPQSPSRGSLMRMLRPLRRALPLSSTMAERIENRGRTAYMGALALEAGRRIRSIFLFLAIPLLYFVVTPPAYSLPILPPTRFDFDGDGLPDSWEQNGIDVNGDRTIDLNLPALGANPRHKDVFVEIDFFDCTVTGGDCAATDTHTHRPLDLALQTVITAFANAPVSNLDGVTGINLRIVRDEELPHRQNCELGATGTPSCFDGIKTTNFGTAAERADPNSANILAAKRLVFHYNLWVHNRARGNGSSGIAEVPGNDFLVSLGSWAGQVGTVNDQTGTFMHELGHNLGLAHGGGDKTNCKPNYLSVMSYTFQIIGLQPGPIFDYSRAALPALPRRGIINPSFSGLLQEGPPFGLDETIGIRDGAFITFYGPPADLDGIDQGSDGDLTDDWLRGQGIGNIDWDNDGNPAERVVADINDLEINDCGSSPNQFLRGFDDWDNLQLRFRDSTDFADGVHTTAVEIQELDVETAEKIRESAGEIDTELPPPEPVSDDCLIDTEGCLIDTEPPLD